MQESGKTLTTSIITKTIQRYHRRQLCEYRYIATLCLCIFQSFDIELIFEDRIQCGVHYNNSYTVQRWSQTSGKFLCREPISDRGGFVSQPKMYLTVDLVCIARALSESFFLTFRYCIVRSCSAGKWYINCGFVKTSPIIIDCQCASMSNASTLKVVILSGVGIT